MSNLNINQLNFNTLSDCARQVIFNLVYPVGSYVSIDNPSFNTVEKVEAYFGGHWEQITDQVLYGVSSDAGVTVGNNEQKVPVPKHTHSVTLKNNDGYSKGFKGAGVSADVPYRLNDGRLPNGFSNNYFVTGGTYDNTAKYSGNQNGGTVAKWQYTPSGEISFTINDSGTTDAEIDVRGKRRQTYIYHRLP